jgi:sigma-B regulation protein RsbU (phosphoserine phosphatase)
MDDDVPIPTGLEEPGAMGPTSGEEALRILVVDDDPLMRSLLEAVLVSLGYTVTTAGDGRQALDLLESDQINLVITDWMMPDVDGLELCRRVRARQAAGYTYIILLTARQDGGALVEGMEAGADDFVTKPPDVDELRVRLAAGRRVLRLERQLERRNRKLATANERLSEAYGRIERDLTAAAAAQRRMLPQPRDLGGLRYDWLFIPSSHVAGDTFNVLGRNDHVVFYQIDVAGHGVPAALLSVSLQRVLSGTGFDIASGEMGTGRPVARSGQGRGGAQPPLPGRGRRRRQLLHDRLRRAGPAERRGGADPGRPPLAPPGRAGRIGIVGRRRRLRGRPAPGRRLRGGPVPAASGRASRAHSDGVVECRNRRDELFAQERLVEFAAARAMPLDASLQALEQRLRQWSEGPAFEDDVSVLVIERGDRST